MSSDEEKDPDYWKRFQNRDGLPYMKEIEQARFMEPEYQAPYASFDLETKDWTHQVSCRFGPGRPCSGLHGTKWTGNSHRYDIFKSCIWKPVGRTPYWAIRWHHGGGEGWLLPCRNNGPEDAQLIEMIASIPDEFKRWDCCHLICEALDKTADAVRRDTAQKYSLAFVEKRLKKRKRNHRISVEILPPETGIRTT